MVLYTFGEGISSKYLIPYNEKVWNVPVEKLSMIWADRIPNPPAEDILKSSIGIKTEGYLHQLYYHYPEEGGYQAISENWSRASDIHFNEEVIKINRLDDIFEIETSKQTYQSKKLYPRSTSLLYLKLVRTGFQKKSLRLIKN